MVEMHSVILRKAFSSDGGDAGPCLYPQLSQPCSEESQIENFTRLAESGEKLDRLIGLSFTFSLAPKARQLISATEKGCGAGM